MIVSRQCSKTACSRPAAATLTYVYADSTVVVGQLSTHAEPHCYDLCAAHAQAFTAPRGWDVVHIQQEYEEAGPSDDDLDALARAVREAGRPRVSEQASGLASVPEQPRASEPRRGHLRVVAGES